MNEHIRKMAEEHFDVRDGVIVSPVDGYVDIEEELQKFAASIIRDCIDVVIESDPSPKMAFNEPYRSVVENIKEHFGV